MTKKGKSTRTSLSTEKPNWKLVEEDFRRESKFVNGDEIFEKVSAEQLEAHLFYPLVQSGRNFAAVVTELIDWKEYLKTRSDNLYHKLFAWVKSEFESICIKLPQPFNEASWQDLETLTEVDLNKIPIFINGMPTTTMSVITTLKTLLKEFEVDVKNGQVFPFEIDSFGFPPINCKKIWNPLIWLRLEVEKIIKISKQHTNPPINQLITSLNLAPKEGHLEKLALTSFFLEKTADNLDYSDKHSKREFMEKLKLMFGTTKVDELTMVLPDILMAYSEELVERVMQVSYFIPYELFRLMFLCWQPKIFKLRLRSEACSSIEDAARIEWDDEEMFTSTTLFNCQLFDRCEPLSLGKEEHIQQCKLIVEASGSRLFDPIHNDTNCDTAGRDFLIIFPMENVLIKRVVTLKNGSSVKVQLKQQLEYIPKTFFWNAEKHSERVVNFELTLTNAKEVPLSLVKKSIPHMVNGRKIGVSFNTEEDAKSIFTEFGNCLRGKFLFVSFFDALNQFIVDLKVVLAD